MDTLPALVQFLRRACFSKVVDTWCKAIDADYFITCPDLSSKLGSKNLPTSIETAKDHLRLARQRIRPTSAQLPLTPPPQPIHQPMMTAGILHTENPAQENLVYMRPVEVSVQIFSDQTVQFPIFSSRGNRSVGRPWRARPWTRTPRPGVANPLLLGVWPWVQAQQRKVPRPIDQPYLHDHQEGHAGLVGSNHIKQKG